MIMTDFEMPTRNPDLPEGKMDSELKARWVAALRSGEYQQGKDYLCNNGNFCCLGVLEEITKAELGTEVSLTANGISLYDKQSGAPSEEHCHYYWGNRFIPMVNIDGKRYTLWSHNDSGNKTFEQLAKAIEEQL